MFGNHCFQNRFYLLLNWSCQVCLLFFFQISVDFQLYCQTINSKNLLKFKISSVEEGSVFSNLFQSHPTSKKLHLLAKITCFWESFLSQKQEIISKLISKLFLQNFREFEKTRYFQKISELQKPNYFKTRKNEKFGKFRLTQGLIFKHLILCRALRSVVIILL